MSATEFRLCAAAPGSFSFETFSFDLGASLSPEAVVAFDRDLEKLLVRSFLKSRSPCCIACSPRSAGLRNEDHRPRADSELLLKKRSFRRRGDDSGRPLVVWIHACLLRI